MKVILPCEFHLILVIPCKDFGKDIFVCHIDKLPETDFFYTNCGTLGKVFYKFFLLQMKFCYSRMTCMLGVVNDSEVRV